MKLSNLNRKENTMLFESLKNAKAYCELVLKDRACIFCQNTKPFGELRYMVIPWPLTKSLESIWPSTNENGQWRLAARVEINDKGEFVTF